MARPLDPPHPLPEASSPVLLLQTPVDVLEAGQPAQRTVAHLTFGWDPFPRVEVTLRELSYTGHGEREVRWQGGALTMQLLRTTNDQAWGVAHPGAVVGPEDATISAARFVVPNLQPLGGDHLTDGAWSWLGRLVLAAGPWTVTLDKRRDAETTIDRQRIRPASAATHVGEIRRADGATFRPPELLEALDRLARILSFLRGTPTAPVLVRGYDGGERPVWDQWVPGHPVAPPTTSRTWVSRPHAGGEEDVIAAFPLLWSLFDDPREARHVGRAVGFYVAANAAPTAESIVFAQASLELQAWLARGRKEPRKIGEAALAELFARYGIPDTIPARIASATASVTPQTAAAVITSVRNRVTHPPREPAHENYDEPWAEASRLAVRMAALGILARAGFRGRYVDVVTGEIAQVPWAPAP